MGCGGSKDAVDDNVAVHSAYRNNKPLSNTTSLSKRSPSIKSSSSGKSGGVFKRHKVAVIFCAFKLLVILKPMHPHLCPPNIFCIFCDVADTSYRTDSEYTSCHSAAREAALP